jgi:hypothetical protein
LPLICASAKILRQILRRRQKFAIEDGDGDADFDGWVAGRPSHRGGWCGTMGGGVATGTTTCRRPSDKEPTNWSGEISVSTGEIIALSGWRLGPKAAI